MADLEPRVGLSLLRMPGQDYKAWLEQFHTAIKPLTYLEIGVGEGESLAFARPPTRAIGVDPDPKIKSEFKAETHLFTQMSDDFFASGHLVTLLNGRPLSLAFIDGGHLFEQALRDFMNIEPHCGSRSVILMHDTVPLDEETQSRVRRTGFHTGDVWKTVLCLKHYRPDLDIFTIATPWTGLTVIIGLDPTSRILVDRYQEAVERFVAMPYAEVENHLEDALSIVANNWDIVAVRLKQRNIT